MLGSYWLKAFKEDEKCPVMFPKRNEVDQINNANISIHEWSKQKRSYIMRENDGQLLETRKQVFMIEAEEIFLPETDISFYSISSILEAFVIHMLNGAHYNYPTVL